MLTRKQAVISTILSIVAVLATIYGFNYYQEKVLYKTQTEYINKTYPTKQELPTVLEEGKIYYKK